MKSARIASLLVPGLLVLAAMQTSLRAADIDEFEVKREEVFEFVSKPQAAIDGDQVTIRFESRANCDVTVVIEDTDGRIVRHLASGVLGPKAPAPLKANSRAQTLVWDGKDDQGRYIDDKASCTVRVSLGLDPQFERTLFWEPKKRAGTEAPIMRATPEGVYVYDGRVFDYVRLFDHQGNYKRTVYPFPAKHIDEVQGLHRVEFPQDGKILAVKEGFHQATMLSCGTNAGFLEELGIGVDRHNNYHGSVWGSAASAMAVRDGRMALARLKMNRLATDGTTGGFPLTGPEVTFELPVKGNWRRDQDLISPYSAAFSPDGRWLYLTGYTRPKGTKASRDIILIGGYEWLPVVARIDFEKGGKLEVFLGGPKLSDAGDAPGEFRIPTSVTVDDAGRIYVCDSGNDRIQVFSPEGKHLESIETPAPVQVEIHHETKELYVFSWYVPDETRGKSAENGPKFRALARGETKPTGKPFDSALTILESYENPKPVFVCELPLPKMRHRFNGQGVPYQATLDTWADRPTVWIVSGWGQQNIISTQGGKNIDGLISNNVRLLELQDDGLKLVRDFTEDAKESVKRHRVAEYFRQRLYVNPKTGMLYVGEGEAAVGKSFKDLIRIDPKTGAVSIVELPFDAEDMAFGPNGLAYLRTFYFISRYDPTRDWMEVPFDYGEEKESLHTSSSSDRREKAVASAIRLPVKDAGLHHHGGMGVSPRGRIAVAVNNYGDDKLFDETRSDSYGEAEAGDGKPYTPQIYPGRRRYGEVHVFDLHGRMIYEDAAPGITTLDGIELDRNDNLYLLSGATRILDGKTYFNDMTSTMLKVPPNGAKMISNSDRAAVRISENARPDRDPDLQGGFAGKSWVEGAEWFYGGVGFAGKNAARSGGGCNCYNARFALDYLARSFVPEIDHYSVAVLDSAGNLILRIGRYGNVDDGKPLIAEGGVPDPHSLGGDEVALFHAPYLATHTDHRLFIADPGNARILSVKLGYHVDERVPLRNVVAPDAR